ncbi:MAG: hypothetical protein ABSG68_02550 [Thermoguttaceae bacterium]|jgi:hypothetical protein
MHNELWYALPLVVAVSLVCAATRHERMRPILIHALRWGVGIVACMAVILGILFLVSLLN